MRKIYTRLLSKEKISILFILFFFMVNQAQAQYEPIITDVNPGGIAPYSTFTIKGYNFSNVNAIYFNAPYTVSFFNILSDTVIEARTGIYTYPGEYQLIMLKVSSPDGYGTYQVAYYPMNLAITAAAPLSGGPGTHVTIKGANFQGAQGVGGVSFGSTPAASFQVVDDSTIIAIVGSGGTGKIAVTPLNGTASPTLGHTFTFNQPAGLPEMTSFSPASGRFGDTITISGNHLDSVTAVHIGGNHTSVPFTIVSATTIKAIVGYTSYGYVSVFTNKGADSLSGFDYFPTIPEITSYSPAAASPGALVAIHGKDLTSISKLTINGAVASFKATSATDGSFIVPDVYSSSSTSVQITNYDNQITTSVSAFTVLPAAPLVTSVTPDTAATGDTVAIKGYFLWETGTVSFGNIAAASFRVVSDSLISAVVGNGATGHVAVTTTSGTDSGKNFTFIPPPPPPQLTITSFSPAFGIAGDSITITGTEFKNVASVFVGRGANSQAAFKVISPTTIRAVVAVHAGTGSVIVNSATGADTAATAFTVGLPAPLITDFSPKSGVTEDTITIVGQNFRKITKVAIGSGMKTTWFTVVSPTTIKAVVNDKYDGGVYVTGQYGADTLGGFTYAVPVPHITSFSPKAAVAGTAIRINGVHLEGVTEVRLLGVVVPFTIVDAATLSATMPDQVLDTTYAITVTTPTEVSYAQGLTLLQTPPPVISTFTPAAGKKGDVITITGSHFANNNITAVTFGGGVASSFQIISDSIISAVVGDDTSGYVAVVTPYITDSISGFSIINKGAFNLINFRAQQTGEYANFSWQTNGEQFTTSFVLECTVGTRKTETTIPASGTSNTVMSYGSSLRLSKEGTNSFRLRMVDAFGNKTYSDTLQLRIDGSVNGVLGAHPNPSRNYVIFDLPASSNAGTLWVYSTGGQLMYTTTTVAGSTSATVYLRPTPLPAGIYRVIWSDGVSSRTTTIVLQ